MHTSGSGTRSSSSVTHTSGSVKRTTYLDYSSESDDDDVPACNMFKITVVGTNRVGKTSLIERLKSNRFNVTVRPTLHIEIHDGVRLGDIGGTLWELPPRVCIHYNMQNYRTDAIVVVFDSDDMSTLRKGVALWKLLHAKLHPDCVPEVWLVYHGSVHVDQVPYIHQARLFQVDTMTNDGILDFLYDMRCTLRRKRVY